MARLAFEVLGAPGRDNAVFVRVQTGQAIHRLLFDCGEHCLASLSLAEIQAIDHLFFSHCHMDHIAGFDTFFRANFNRVARPNHIWGPPQTAAIVQHRMQGFMWNLADRLQAAWHVHDVLPAVVASMRYNACEAFAVAHRENECERLGALLDHCDYRVDALELDHGTPSLGYVVRTAPRRNIAPERLAELGIAPGPWIQRVKHPQPGDADTLELNGRTWAIAELQRRLLTITPGESLAYLTDFFLPDQALLRVAGALAGVDTLICESQYHSGDEELARRNYHMTAARTARLAAAAQVGRLVLFHVSERYTSPERAMLLAEAQAMFPATTFPPGW